MTAALHSTRPTSPVDRLLLHAGLALVALARRRASRVASPGRSPASAEGEFLRADRPALDMLVRDGVRHTTFR